MSGAGGDAESSSELFVPATVMPVTSQLRFMVRDDHEVKSAFGDREIAPGAQILLARSIGLHRADRYPEKIAHNTKAIALPMASTTMNMSKDVIFCSRNGLKPMVER